MPFGNESTWDLIDLKTTQDAGPGHQCLSATSPLGTFLALALLALLGLVTNAFRQRVHLGPLHKGATAKLARE